MDKFFVNPGSATGAFASGWPIEGEDVVPSFCLMDVRWVGPSSPESLGRECVLTCGLGARDLPDTLCLPAEERCEWC